MDFKPNTWLMIYIGWFTNILIKSVGECTLDKYFTNYCYCKIINTCENVDFHMSFFNHLTILLLPNMSKNVLIITWGNYYYCANLEKNKNET